VLLPLLKREWDSFVLLFRTGAYLEHISKSSGIKRRVTDGWECMMP